MRSFNLQHGFAAIAAIFLVVLMAALGSFMLSFSNTQQLSSAQDIQGSRAYWAARAGLEWGLATSTSTCTTGSTLSIDAGNTFSVEVTRAPTSYSEGGETRVICRITAVARLPGIAVGTLGYIERSVSASMERSASP
jgi:MSHA biogenesis protein MshP